VVSDFETEFDVGDDLLLLLMISSTFGSPKPRPSSGTRDLSAQYAHPRYRNDHEDVKSASQEGSEYCEEALTWRQKIRLSRLEGKL
jgi:hypothetical protein